MNKWQDVPSLNFKVSICKDMLFSDGVAKLFSSCPTRSTIPKDLRPKSLFRFDKSYVIAFIQNVFSRLDITIDHESLDDLLNEAAYTSRTTKASIDILSTQSKGYIDDFNDDYAIAIKIVDFFSCTECITSPRNEKAAKLAASIKDLINPDVYHRAYIDYFNSKVQKL